ncbi:MAG: hypothetical protein ACJA2G_001839 [Cognaticolwellia sp.]
MFGNYDYEASFIDSFKDSAMTAVVAQLSVSLDDSMTKTSIKKIDASIYGKR